MIGRTVAHYTILEKLGEGGMGEVWKARDAALNRDVAIKVLPEFHSADSRRVRRFEREARVLAALEHPNIASVYGFHDEGGARFLAMELIEGETLAASVTDDGLALDRLLSIGIPLADAIAFAHDNGVIHRDIKPDNVMLDSHGRVRVLDFGLAGLRPEISDKDSGTTVEVFTVEGQVFGTVAYMAPEQLQGEAVDARADIFAVGIVLYELSTGRNPFRSGSPAATASAILRDEPASLLELRPDLPVDFARVIRRCLEKDPERRIQTAKDVRNELEEIRVGVRTEKTEVTGGSGEHLGQPVEHRMRISTEHVRSLSTQIPRMVGDTMTYLDNERTSDVLVIYVPGIGFDQREYEDHLRQTPFRAAAVSLYGFGPNARMRPPLPFRDHNRLLAFLMEEIQRRIRPKTFVLSGMSSGADQALHVLSSADAERIRPNGLILLGPMVRAEGARVARVYASMADDPASILDGIRTLAKTADDLDSWLYIHEYLVSSFEKLGTDISALREFARGYIQDCSDESFFPRFRAVLEQVRVVNCVFSEEEREDSDFVLDRHIRDDALGAHFSEEMMVADAARRHAQLKAPSVLLPLVKEVVRRASE